MRALLKRLEGIGKRVLALFASIVLWRPWRRDRADDALARAARVLVVRVDDRVGEAVLLTPVLATLKTRDPQPEVHLLVHEKVERILLGHPAVDRIWPLDRSRLWMGAFSPQMKRLRAQHYDVVVDCGNWAEPSVTHAVLARLAGPKAARLGSAIFPVGALRTHPVTRRPDTRVEVLQRLHLLSPMSGLRPEETLTYRAVSPSDEIGELVEAMHQTPYAVVNPGGRLGWRRMPAEAFATACRVLEELGRRPVVTWGPGEEGLAQYVADSVPGALLAPPTTLDDLAALLAAAGLTVCNNTGPMHLSVAVGAPTLQLFLHMDPVRWGHADAPNRVVDLTSLVSRPDDLEARVADEVRTFVAAVQADAEGRGVA